MSDPWIKVYPSDMRADPKFAGMNADLQLALIHAWDVAKNGPGDVAELRASDGRAMSERELRHLVRVSASATRRMFERWASVGLCEYADGLVSFPNLAKRQGIDRTHALRQKRYRERKRDGSRDGRVTKVRDGEVTGQNQNQNIEPSPTPPRDIHTVWDAYGRHHDQAKLTPQRRDLIKRRLGQYEAATLICAIDGNHRDPFCNGENQTGKTYHSLELILRDADHIEKYAALATNGHATPKTWTTEDAERAANQRREDEARLAAQLEDIPF